MEQVTISKAEYILLKEKAELLKDSTFMEKLRSLMSILEKEKVSTKPGKKRQFGSHKGLIKHMSDDFDEPLDDFKDYM